LCRRRTSTPWLPSGVRCTNGYVFGPLLQSRPCRFSHGGGIRPVSVTSSIRMWAMKRSSACRSNQAHASPTICIRRAMRRDWSAKWHQGFSPAPSSPSPAASTIFFWIFLVGGHKLQSCTKMPRAVFGSAPFARHDLSWPRGTEARRLHRPIALYRRGAGPSSIARAAKPWFSVSWRTNAGPYGRWEIVEQHKNRISSRRRFRIRHDVVTFRCCWDSTTQSAASQNSYARPAVTKDTLVFPFFWRPTAGSGHKPFFRLQHGRETLLLRGDKGQTLEGRHSRAVLHFLAG